MSRLTCPHPQRCAATWHQSGSKAARSCAGRAPGPAGRPLAVVPSLPGPASARRGPDLDALLIEAGNALPGRSELVALGAHAPGPTALRALNQALESQDQREGWTNRAGAEHPTGGYARREITLQSSDHVVVVRFFDQTGELHRDDGPAMVALARDDASVLEAHWRVRGMVHRDDGPSDLYSENRGGHLGALFYLSDQHLVGAATDDEAVMNRWRDLVGACAGDRVAATSWLAYDDVDGEQEDADRWIAAGADVSSMLALARAGVREDETVSESLRKVQ